MLIGIASFHPDILKNFFW